MCVYVCVKGMPPAQCNDRQPNEKLGSDWLADKAAHCIIMSWIIDAHTYTSMAALAKPTQSLHQASKAHEA